MKEGQEKDGRMEGRGVEVMERRNGGRREVRKKGGRRLGRGWTKRK